MKDGCNSLESTWLSLSKGQGNPCQTLMFRVLIKTNINKIELLVYVMYHIVNHISVLTVGPLSILELGENSFFYRFYSFLF